MTRLAHTSGRPRRHRIRWLAAVALAAHSALVTTALAEVTCSFEPDTGVLTVTLGSDGDEAVIARSNSFVSVNGARCGPDRANRATVTNTSRVVVNDVSDGNTEVIIDLSGGEMAPGDATEATGDSEIEFEVNFDGPYDHLTVLGTSGSDAFRLGQLGINLNGDDDPDVSVGDEWRISLFGAGAADVISGAGGLGTGVLTSDRLEIQGGAGRDRVIGGAANDSVWGGPGSDRVVGGIGNDQLQGDSQNAGQGDDVVIGGSGNDLLSGDAGADEIIGGNGRDNGVLLSDGAFDSFTGGDEDDLATLMSDNAVEGTLDGKANDGDPTSNGGSGENDLVEADVEGLAGGVGDDLLIGNSGNNSLLGSFGVDTLRGLGGDDSLRGDVHDAEEFGLGYPGDHLQGGNGTDTLNAEDGLVDVVNGGDGVDPPCTCDPDDIQTNIP